MRRLALWLVMWLLGLGSLRAADSLAGEWIGGFEHDGNWVFVQTTFSPITRSYFGMINMIEFPVRESLPLQAMGKQLDNVKLEDSQAHFEITVRSNKYSFDGALTNGVIMGNTGVDGMKFPLRLEQMAPVQVAPYVGIFQVEAGHYITFRQAIGVSCLISVDSLTGQSRLFIPKGENTFSCGPEVMKVYPVEASIHFTTNGTGQCTAMDWKPEHGAALSGRPGKFHEEEVSFTNGATALSGTVILPPTRGPYPGVVLVADSGPGTRENLRFMADFFALNGVAALVYDKRGTGKSKGEWQKTGFDGSAGDVLAAAELLRSRTNINPRVIGLWAMGAGGWISGLAASRSTNLAFIICLSGSGVTPQEQAVYGIEHRLRAGGFSDADLRDALALYRQVSRCAQTGTNWDECETAVKVAQNKPWYGRDLSPYDRKNQEQWRLVWNFDPVPALQKVTCPVLALYGELDAFLPARKTADIWQAALKQAGNKDVTINVLPQSDHGLMDARMGVPGPAFYISQRDWLLKHLKSEP